MAFAPLGIEKDDSGVVKLIGDRKVPLEKSVQQLLAVALTQNEPIARIKSDGSGKDGELSVSMLMKFRVMQGVYDVCTVPCNSTSCLCFER